MHTLIEDLAIVTLVAAVTGMLARRLGQPSILGYLFAGLIVGPSLPVPLFADPQRTGELAEVGVVLVMFAVGLEFRIKRLLEILPVSGLTAAAQIGALAWAGFAVGGALGWTTPASVCLGATLAISSTMVVSAVLRSTPVDDDVRAHVFGILVVQDAVAIVLIAIVTALASGHSLGVGDIGLLVGQLAGAVVLMLVVGVLLLPRLVRHSLTHPDTDALVVLVSGAAFGLATAAHHLGYSVALGAFICGMAVAESGRGHAVADAVAPLRSLFSAIFFVSIGMNVDPFTAWQNLPLALGLSALVVVAQFTSVTLATVLTGHSMRRGAYSGLALGQIGELSFILATIAIAGGVVPRYTLPVLVTVATITAFTTPWLLGRAQRVVTAIDHLIPTRGHEVITAYQALVRRARRPEGASAISPAIKGVLLDWAALVVVFVARHSALALVGEQRTLLVNAVAGVAAVPFVIGLALSAKRLLHGVRELARGRDRATPRAMAVEAIALLAIVLGVGLPTVALLAPLVDAPWLEATMVASVLMVLVLLGIRLSRAPVHTSGVMRLAIEVADRGGAGDSHPDAPQQAPAASPLAGLDFHTIVVPTEGGADGVTLRELDLRARTGATVVAWAHAGQTMALPSADARLSASDVLAVSGSPAAVERARALIGGPAPRSADEDTSNGPPAAPVPEV